jgi:hypothetical protein
MGTQGPEGDEDKDEMRSTSKLQATGNNFGDETIRPNFGSINDAFDNNKTYQEPVAPVVTDLRFAIFHCSSQDTNHTATELMQ